MNFSILSMIFVDSYLLYKACCGPSNKHTPQSFFEEMACQLIDFIIEPPKAQQPQQSTKGTKKNRIDTRLFISRKRKHSAYRDLVSQVTQERTKRKRQGTNWALQGRCRVCKERTTNICYACSDDDQARQCWMCEFNEHKGFECWNLHCQ